MEAWKETEDRHCAYSSGLIPKDRVKRCSKCHRRAYCGRDCQAKDWIKGEGDDGEKSQGHKNWCGIPYGEEDIDWVVLPVEGKGEGLIAKRHFPVLSKIIVDGNNDKGEWEGRIFKANHACNPNAERYFDHDFQVSILYAKRDICPGEEITVSYINWANYKGTNEYGVTCHSFEDCRRFLLKKFNVSCHSTCFCNDAEMEELLADYQAKLSLAQNDLENNACAVLANTGLEVVAELLEVNKKACGNWRDRARLLKLGFYIGIKQFDTQEQALAYLEEMLEIVIPIYHPKSKEVKQIRTWKADPKTCIKYYLRIELDKIILKD